MRRVALVLAAVALLLAGWLGWVVYLTAANDRACREAARGPRESGSAARSEELRRVLERYSAKNGGVGLQASVIFPDGKVWSGTSGCANNGKRCRLTLDHHLYVGSMTKLFTATLVMEQVQKGTISLDDTLEGWVDLPYAKNVTVRMLLNHTSGIPNYTEDAWFIARYFGIPSKQWSPDEMVGVIEDKPLEFEPGSRYEYSNSNYLPLGMILQKETGKPYEVLLRDGVTKKVGLRDTFFMTYYPDDLAIADGYDEAMLPFGRTNLTGFRTSFATRGFSGGGILSDSEDVARFTHSLFTGRILSEPALAQMETFVKAPDEHYPEQKGYGLGVRNMMIGVEALVGHTGIIGGRPTQRGEELHHSHPEQPLRYRADAPLRRASGSRLARRGFSRGRPSQSPAKI